MTDKATSMLEMPSEMIAAALLVGVLSGGCSGYMYDLQIVEHRDTVSGIEHQRLQSIGAVRFEPSVERD